MAVLLCGVALFVWAVRAMRVYCATATILIPASSETPAQGGLIGLLLSRHVLSRTADDLRLPSVEWAALRTHLETAEMTGSDGLSVSFHDRTARRAVDGVNAAAEELVRYHREIVAARYDALIARLTQQLARCHRKLRTLDVRIDSLSALDPEVALAGASDGPNRGLLALEQQRAQLQIAASGDAAALVAAGLKASEAANFAGDRARLAALDRAIRERTLQLAGVREPVLALTELQRDRAAGDQAYGDLFRRLARARADETQAAAAEASIVIERASQPQLPALGQPAVLATVLGFASVCLAVTAAFVLDAVDTRLFTPEALEDAYGYPVFNSVD